MEQKLKVKVSIIEERFASVYIEGELTVFVEGFELLMKEITAYIKMGIYEFILDLSNLNYIDSSGIGIIMRIITTATKSGRLVCIICEQPQILKVFTVSNIDRFVKYVSSIEEGINYFREKEKESK